MRGTLRLFNSLFNIKYVTDNTRLSKNCKMKVTTENLVELYKKHANVCDINKAEVYRKDGQVNVVSIFSQRDLERSEQIKFRQHLVLDQSGTNILFSLPVADCTQQLLANQHSGTGKRVILTKSINKSGKDKQYLEIWSSNKKERIFDTELLKVHGKIYEDALFGCLNWSPDGKFVLYVAEKKEPKKESFFKSDTENASETVVKGEEFALHEDWGEALVGKYQPVLCVLNTETGQVAVCQSNINGNEFSAGQAVWTSNGEGIVFVGRIHTPFRLGITYCTNRKSVLLYANKELSSIVCLVDDDSAVYSPKFSPNGTSLAYITFAGAGPHYKTATLNVMTWETKSIVKVVDIVRKPAGREFPGLYPTQIAARFWSEDSKRIILQSAWRSTQELICCNVESKQVTRITNDGTVGFWTLLDVHEDFLVVSCSSLNLTPELRIGKLPERKEAEIKWTKLVEGRIIKEIDWSVFPINTPEGDIGIEAVFFNPLSTPKGLIVWPHGGPHSVSSAGYNLYAHLFVELGFAAVMINYRGSIGFGEDGVNSLPGNISRNDVQDVKLAIDTVLTKYNVPQDKLILFGGSHGGFLVTQLSGQYPDLFKACVCRNPVINICGMAGSSDIPDWACIEAGYAYNTSCVPSADPYTMLKTMLDVSPVRYMNQVKVPTLMLVGLQDHRVHWSQSLEYYRSLKARGVPVKMYTYEDNHPLEKVETESDAFIHIAQWFLEYV